MLQDDLTFIEPKWAVSATAFLNIFGGTSDINEIRAAKA
jgi:hypothetical protein